MFTLMPYEWIRTSRQAWPWRTRVGLAVVFLAVAGVVDLAVEAKMEGLRRDKRQAVAGIVAIATIACHWYAALLYAPFLTAHVMATQRQRGDFPLLMVTPMPAMAVFVAKLARVMRDVAAALVAMSVPSAMVMAACGASPWPLLLNLPVSLAIAWILANVALFAGVWCERFEHSVLVTLGLTGLVLGACGSWLVFPLFELALHASMGRVVVATDFPLKLAGCFVLGCAWLAAANFSVRYAWLGQPLAVAVRKGAAKPPAKRPDVWQSHPLMWRELHCGYTAMDKRLARIMLVLGSVFATVVIAGSIAAWPRSEPLVGGMFVFSTAMGVTMAASVGGNALLVEQRSGMFEFLRPSLLTQRDLVHAKLVQGAVFLGFIALQVAAAAAFLVWRERLPPGGAALAAAALLTASAQWYLFGLWAGFAHGANATLISTMGGLASALWLAAPAIGLLLPPSMEILRAAVLGASPVLRCWILREPTAADWTAAVAWTAFDGLSAWWFWRSALAAPVLNVE